VQLQRLQKIQEARLQIEVALVLTRRPKEQEALQRLGRLFLLRRKAYFPLGEAHGQSLGLIVEIFCLFEVETQITPNYFACMEGQDTKTTQLTER
jgi:hypothetical protein